MAAPAGTFLSSSAVGNREALHDFISILNKDETPFQTAIGSDTGSATKEEWQLDSIGSGNTANFQNEGDDFAGTTITASTRVGNRMQIMRQNFIISETQEVVKKAGRDSEVSYQTALFGRRIKIDLEMALCRNQASTAGAPRKMGGYESWISSNVSRGATGGSGGFSGSDTVAATDGTQRTSTEALLQTVIKSAWDNGGHPSVLLMGSAQKQNFSGFTGIATQFQEPQGKMATVIGAVDRYVSDFGTFSAVASRWVRGREIEILDPALLRVIWLRKWKKLEIPRTGDARKFAIIGEMTLEVRNEAGCGIVADLT